MQDIGLLAVGFLMNLVAVLFVVTAVILVLIILVQRGKGGGISGAFGGGMAGGLMGSKTGDFLTWVTIGLVAIFLVMAVLMAKFYKPSVGSYGQGASRQGAPAATEMPQQGGQAGQTSQQPQIPAGEDITPSTGTGDINIPTE